MILITYMGGHGWTSEQKAGMLGVSVLLMGVCAQSKN